MSLEHSTLAGTVRSSLTRQTGVLLVSLSLIVVGIVFVANPLYLTELSVYPGVGWPDLPLLSSAIASLGILCLLVGLACLFERLNSLRIVLGIALGTVALLALWDAIVPLVHEPTVQGVPVEPVEGYFYKKLFIGSLVGASFAVGALLFRNRRMAAVAGVLIPLPFLLATILDWWFRAQLELVVDLLWFLTEPVVLDISFLGSWILLAAFLLGFAANRYVST